MPKSEILTPKELEQFIARLRATAEKAEEADALRLVISKFVSAGGKLPKGVAAGRGRRALVEATRKAARSGRRGSRTALDTNRIVQELSRAKEGLSASQLGELIGEESRQRILGALDRLRSEGKVRLVGERRTARWFAA